MGQPSHPLGAADDCRRVRGPARHRSRRATVTSEPAPTASPRAAASSIAWHAPWPRLASIGWAASPSRPTRPSDQRLSGGRSYWQVRTIACSSVASISSGIGSCQIPKRRSTAAFSSAADPPARSPVRALAHQYAWLPPSMATPKRPPRPHDSPGRRRSASDRSSGTMPRRRVAGVARRPIPHQRRPYPRIETISTNHEIAVLGAPVGQADRHPSASWATPTHLAPSRRTCWSRAPSRIVWSSPRWTTTIGASKRPTTFSTGLLRVELLVRCGGPHRTRPRPRPRWPPDFQPLQHPHRVRPQQDAGADLAHLGGLLENDHLESGSAQSDRCAKSTDASADDDDLPRWGQDLTFSRQSQLSYLTLRAGLAPRIGRFAGMRRADLVALAE